MNKWMKALAIGMQILSALESVRAKQPAVVEVDWKGIMYKITLEQSKLQF